MAVECIRAAGVLGSTSLQAQRRRCAAQHVRCALVRILPCFGVKRRTGVGAPSVSPLARGPRCFLTPFPLYEHLTSRATLIPVAFPFLPRTRLDLVQSPSVIGEAFKRINSNEYTMMRQRRFKDGRNGWVSNQRLRAV